LQPSRPNPVSASASAIGEQSIISDLSFSDQSLHHQFQHIETLLHSNENSLVKYEEYYFNRQQQQQQQQTTTATSSSSGNGMEMEAMNGSSDGYVKEDQVMPSSSASGSLMKVMGIGMPTIQERNMNSSASADSMTLVTSNSPSNETHHHHHHNGPPQSSSSVSISSSFNMTSTTTNTATIAAAAAGGGGGGMNSSSKSVVQKALHYASKIFSAKQRSSDLQQLQVESSELLLAVNPTDNHLPSQHYHHQQQQNHDQYDPRDKLLESGRMNYLSTETIDTALSSTSNDVSNMLHTSSPSLIVGAVAGTTAFNVSPSPPKGAAITPLRSHSGRTIVQQSSKT